MIGVIEKNEVGQCPPVQKLCYNGGMKKRTALEPGLLPVFRIFMSLYLGFYLITVLFWLFHVVLGLPFEPHDTINNEYQLDFINPFDLCNLVEATLVVIYLWLSPLQRWLGRFFLPLGLALATVGPSLARYFRLEMMPDISVVDVLVGPWQLIPVLFVPLVLIAWQYSFRAVVLYSLVTALFNYFLTLSAIGFDNPDRDGVGCILAGQTGAFLLVGYIIGRLMKAQRQQRQALAQANAKLAHYATTLEQLTTSRERNRLARELHDTLAHTLSGTAVQLEAAKTLWETEPQQAQTMLDKALKAIRCGLTETRRALQALRASPLEDLGLDLAVRDLAESVAAQTGATLDWQGPDTPQVQHVSPAIEQCVYRVAQEALANVAKHASPQHLTVQLVKNNGQMTLAISDDGRGFERAGRLKNDSPHFGLRGMWERAEMIGGFLEIDSQPGRGTSVRLIVEEPHDPGLDL